MNLESSASPLARRAQRGGVEARVENVDRAIQQARALALDLRPAILDHLGLPAALRWFVDRMPRGGPSDPPGRGGVTKRSTALARGPRPRPSGSPKRP